MKNGQVGFVKSFLQLLDTEDAQCIMESAKSDAIELGVDLVMSVEADAWGIDSLLTMIARSNNS